MIKVAECMHKIRIFTRSLTCSNNRFSIDKWDQPNQNGYGSRIRPRPSGYALLNSGKSEDDGYVPYRKNVNEEIEFKKLWQLYHRRTIKDISLDVPVEEQKTVRVAFVGRPNSGKSALINAMLGWDACVVGNTPGSTRMTQFQTMVRGNILYEFVDAPGVPDIISEDGVGEYTFRRANVLKAKKKFGGNVSLSQNNNANFVTNDIFVKNADIVIICAAMDSRMTLDGNLTTNVYHLLKRNPHVPAVLALTKSDLYRYRTSNKYKNMERRNEKSMMIMEVIDKITEGHINGKEYKKLATRPTENIIQMKPLTVKIEDSGLEMLRPMRISRMSSVRQIESILRLTNSWRWSDLNEYQQRLYELGNRGWRYFNEVIPTQSNLPQSIFPILDNISKRAVYRPWNIDESINQALSPREILEEHVSTVVQSLVYKQNPARLIYNLEHLEVNGRKPSDAEIRVKINVQVPESHTTKAGELINWMGNKKFTRLVRRDYKMLLSNKVRCTAVAEHQLKTVFGVKQCEVNLKFPAPGEVSETDTIMDPTFAPEEEFEMAKIKSEMLNANTYYDPETEVVPDLMYRDDHDLHFMDTKSKMDFLRQMGSDSLRRKGLLQESRRSASPHKYPKEDTQNLGRFRSNSDRL